MSELVVSEHHCGIDVIRLNRPEKLNAINQPLIAALLAALQAAIESDSQVIVLCGAGRAFSAGNDLSNDESSDPQHSSKCQQQSLEQRVAQLQEVTRLICGSQKVVIGAIQGWAVGAGFEWALNCDLTIWGESTRAFMPELRLGVFPTGGSLTLLPRLAGAHRAREMFLLGDELNAQDLYAMGVANRVVADESVMEEAMRMARRIAELPPQTVARFKSAFAEAQFATLNDAIGIETDALIGAVTQQMAASA